MVVYSARPVFFHYKTILIVIALVVPVATLPSTRVVYYLHTESATWNEASSTCKSYGAFLVTFPDFDATNNSVHYVNTQSWDNALDDLQNGFWTGLYKNSTDNLRWQGCTDYDVTAQLPVVDTRTGSSPSCYVSDVSFHLSPLGCSESRPYICQRDDNQCWFQPYIDAAIDDPDITTTHVNDTTAADEGDCAKLCRSAVENERECWAFTFKDQGCRLQFSDDSHKYALDHNPEYFHGRDDYTAYVKICTGGWKTSLKATVTDSGAIPQDENCTTAESDAWDDKVCYCECDQPPVILEAETLVMTIDEKVEQIVKDLQVNPDNTSSTRRKKESAEDSRPSAQGIGYFGVGFLVFIFGGIFLLDVNVIFAHVAQLCKRQKESGQPSC